MYLRAWTVSLGSRGASWWSLDEWPVRAAWTSSSVMDYGNNDSCARVSAPGWYLSISPGNTRQTPSLFLVPRLVTRLSIDLLSGVWSILFRSLLKSRRASFFGSEQAASVFPSSSSCTEYLNSLRLSSCVLSTWPLCRHLVSWPSPCALY